MCIHIYIYIFIIYIYIYVYFPRNLIPNPNGTTLSLRHIAEPNPKQFVVYTPCCIMEGIKHPPWTMGCSATNSNPGSLLHESPDSTNCPEFQPPIASSKAFPTIKQFSPSTSDFQHSPDLASDKALCRDLKIPLSNRDP